MLKALAHQISLIFQDHVRHDGSERESELHYSQHDISLNMGHLIYASKFVSFTIELGQHIGYQTSWYRSVTGSTWPLRSILT